MKTKDGLKVFSLAITENTKVSFGLLASVIAIVFWLVIEKVKAIEEKQESYVQIVQRIDVRLGRIEGKLGVNGE